MIRYSGAEPLAAVPGYDFLSRGTSGRDRRYCGNGVNCHEC
jgi:hypothetical protein